MFQVLQSGVKKSEQFYLLHEITIHQRLICFCIIVVLWKLFYYDKFFCSFYFIADSGNVLLVGLAQTLTHYTYAGQKLVSLVYGFLCIYEI